MVMDGADESLDVLIFGELSFSDEGPLCLCGRNWWKLLTGSAYPYGKGSRRLLKMQGLIVLFVHVSEQQSFFFFCHEDP